VTDLHKMWQSCMVTSTTLHQPQY